MTLFVLLFELIGELPNQRHRLFEPRGRELARTDQIPGQNRVRLHASAFRRNMRAASQPADGGIVSPAAASMAWTSVLAASQPADGGIVSLRARSRNGLPIEHDTEIATHSCGATTFSAPIALD
ncbi:MAG: hypothetical protein ACREIA_05585 [Opitutaceae bacterium]